MNAEQINRAKVLKKRFGWLAAVMTLSFFGFILLCYCLAPGSKSRLFGLVAIISLIIAVFAVMVRSRYHLEVITGLIEDKLPRCPTGDQILPENEKSLAEPDQPLEN